MYVLVVHVWPSCECLSSRGFRVHNVTLRGASNNGFQHSTTDQEIRETFTDSRSDRQSGNMSIQAL